MSPLVYTLVATHITIAAVTIFLHRSQAHRSVTLNPIVSHFFRLWLWLTTGMETKQWVAIHRKHHATCETEDDPHSPIHKGVWNVLFLGVVLYKKEAANQGTMDQYGQGTPDDWLERNVYTKHSAKGILMTLAFNVAMFGPVGIVCWFIQMAWIPFWAAGFINGVGHYIGYRTFASKDTSTNISPLILPLGIIIGGEEFHNNHHAFPRSAKLSYKWWEFDIGWMYINILSFLGLAKVINRLPKPSSHRKVFRFVDTNTLFASKMLSLRNFDRNVTSKILKTKYTTIKASIGLSYKKICKILSTDKGALNAFESKKFADTINSSQTLKKISNLRNSFEEVWHGVGISVSERVEKIKKWCVEAEKCKDGYIDNFIMYIRKKMNVT